MEEKNINKEHLFLKARMLSEGVDLTSSKELSPELYRAWSLDKSGKQKEVELPKKLDLDNPMALLSLFGEMKKEDTTVNFRPEIRFDSTGLRAQIHPNKRSRLELLIEGDTASVIEKGKTLITGKFPKRLEWLDQKLGGGINATVGGLLPAMSAQVINVVISLSCFNYNTGRGCRFCNLFSNPISRKISILPMKILKLWAMGQGRAVKIAVDNGWKGSFALSGGALAPAQRGEYLERLEVVLTTLKKALGDEKFSQIPKLYNHYPPEDFADMHKWKEMGITSVGIDLEVMDDAYYAAICPGKSAYKPLSYVRKAQEYSVKVFGPLFGTTGLLVMGIEPMSTLVAGYEERMSKGILPMPVVFHPEPNSAYEGFRPPTAEWIVEASDKMADSFMKHFIKWLPAAIEHAEKWDGSFDLETGFANVFNSLSHQTILFDEIQLRLDKLLDGRPFSALIEG